MWWSLACSTDTHTASIETLQTLQTPGMRMYWENNWYLRFIVLVTTARLVTAGGTQYTTYREAVCTK